MTWLDWVTFACVAWTAIMLTATMVMRRRMDRERERRVRG